MKIERRDVENEEEGSPPGCNSMPPPQPQPQPPAPTEQPLLEGVPSGESPFNFGGA